MEPTIEQLRAFYRVTRQAVRLFSCVIEFVELGEDQNLYVHIARYDPRDVFVIVIDPTGEYEPTGDQ
jgi:hypothetical protein